MMLDPITNQIASQAAQRAAMARRPQEARARTSEKGRAEDADSFETILGEVEPIGPARPLADADQEEAREDRMEHRAGPGESGEHAGGRLDLTA